MQGQTLQQRFNLLPKQYEFFEATDDEVLFSGAFGCGKSFALCVKCYVRAMRPGAREALIRLKRFDLYGTTVRTLLHGDGRMPAVIPKGTYELNQKTNTVTLAGGGEILLVGLDADRDKEGSRIGSLNLTGAGIDQCEEVPEKFWNLVNGRLRVDVGIPRQLYGVCNPGAPSHHLAQRFGIAKKTTPAHGCRVIMTETADNPHLPADYLAKVRRYQGILYKRYVKGLWVANEGAIYPMFEREIHTKVVGNAAFKSVFFSVDDGFANPFCLQAWGVRANGALHIIDEVHERELAEQQKVLAARKMVEKYGEPDYIVCDPAAAAIKGALRKSGFTVVNANNDVLEGISEMQSLLYHGPNFEPRLTIDPRCTQTIASLESYTWKDEGKKDEPVKEDDHGADAARYGAMSKKKPIRLLFERDDLKDTVMRIHTTPHEFEGDIEHNSIPGVSMDLSIARAEAKQVYLRPAKWPTLRLWNCLDLNNLPKSDRRYIMFAGMGEGGMALICDTQTRMVVGEWEDATATVEETARRISMLSLLFGHRREDGKLLRAMLGYSRRGPGGGLTAELRRLRHDSLFRHRDEDEPGWLPNPQEWADAVQDLRVQVVAGKILTFQDEFVPQAQSYAWNQAGTVVPLHLLDAPEDKGTHMDWVVLMAGLAQMLKSAATNPINMPVMNPQSMEARIRLKHGKKAKV